MSDAPIAPYLTYIPDRSPHHKVHESLGQAKKAVLFRIGGRFNTLTVPVRVYEWTEKGWVTKWEIPQGTERAHLPWM